MRITRKVPSLASEPLPVGDDAWKVALCSLLVVWSGCSGRAEAPSQPASPESAVLPAPAPSAAAAEQDAFSPVDARVDDAGGSTRGPAPEARSVATRSERPLELPPRLPTPALSRDASPSPSAVDPYHAVIAKTFQLRLRALDACADQATPGGRHAARGLLTVDLQVASRGIVHALHVVEAPASQDAVVDCARLVLRRLRFNPGPEQDTAYRFVVVVGAPSRLESWHIKPERLSVDDPKPPPAPKPATLQPSALEEVLRDGKIKGTAEQVLGHDGH